MAIVVLNVAVTFVGETVLQEAEHRHDSVVERFRTREIRHGDVNVVDADDFEVHASLVYLFDSHARRRALQSRRQKLETACRKLIQAGHVPEDRNLIGMQSRVDRSEAIAMPCSIEWLK